MAPRTGPMHGVHPTAKAIPSGSAAAGPGRMRDNSGRSSRYSHAPPRRRAYSSMNRPNARTTAPAARSPFGDRNQVVRALPANAPKAAKTTVNPRMNRAIDPTWPAVARLAAPPAASARSPVTNERYPGTSGRTHGEANETTPAAKARTGAHHAWIPEVTSPTMGPHPPRPGAVERGVLRIGRRRAIVSLMLVNGFTSGPPRRSTPSSGGERGSAPPGTVPPDRCLRALRRAAYNPPTAHEEEACWIQSM